MVESTNHWRVWIDGCGGFTVVTADRWSVGRAGDRRADDQSAPQVGLVSDLPPVAGWFARDGQQVVFEPTGDKPVNDLSATTVDFGIGSVRLGVVCPSPLNRTRLVTVVPPHRWSGHVDGVLWIDEAATIGSGSQHSLRHLGLKEWFVLTPPKMPTATKTAVGWCLRRPKDGWQTELVLGRREKKDELSLTIQVAGIE